MDETAFSGSTAPAIRKVLRRFDVPRTVAFFRELGVELKREETGKLFPVTDRARTVLDALLAAARDAGIVLRHPWLVAGIAREKGTFVLTDPKGNAIRAARVVLATGGRSRTSSGPGPAGTWRARRPGRAAVSPTTPHPASDPLARDPVHIPR